MNPDAPADGPAEVIAARPEGAQVEQSQAEEPMYNPRRVAIRFEDLEKYGYTIGCRKCLAIREGRSVRGVPHTPACRARMEQCFTDDADPRHQAAQDRINEEIGRRGEARLDGGEEEQQEEIEREGPAV